jgi:pantothenate kinase
VKIDFKTRHVFKQTQNEFKVSGPFQTILNKENNVISILKTTTAVLDDMGNKTFTKALILSFANQTGQTICNQIKQEGGERIPLSHTFMRGKIWTQHIIRLDGDFATSNSSHNPITPSTPKSFFPLCSTENAN